jgi:pyruvate kinase
MSKRHPALEDLFARRGMVTRIARGLNISTAAVSTWKAIPPKRAEEVARLLGVPVSDLPVRGAPQ